MLAKKLDLSGDVTKFFALFEMESDSFGECQDNVLSLNIHLS